MESGEASSTEVRERLRELRNTLLSLHKALLDSERTAYELVHGRIGSPAAFLQLLINDPWFAWLRPVTTLLVQIDEGLAAKNPPRTSRELEQLMTDTRALLSPSSESDAFWKRYSNVVQRDPGVLVMHQQLEEYLR